jgi:hypothetical protein
MDWELLSELYGEVLAVAVVGGLLLVGAWLFKTLSPGGDLPTVGPAVGIAGAVLAGAGITGAVLYANSKVD